MKVLPWSRRVAPHFVDTSITVLVIIAAGSVIWKHLGASALRNWRESPPTAAKISIPLPSALPLVPDSPLRLDGPIEGPPAASITVVAFSDFECPFCRRFALETLPEFRAQFLRRGDVRFAFKHLPIEEAHPEALRAALVAECAARQDKFWAVHDRIFSEQALLGRALDGLLEGPLLDRKSLQSCLAHPEALARIHRDVEEARGLGLRMTPTIVVGWSIDAHSMRPDQVLPGAVTLAELGRAVSESMARKGASGR